MYTVTKTFPHSLGLSCAFRQWRAKSHCSRLHGYALEIVVTFGASELDANGWVVDFGALDPLKDELRRWFDHTVVIAQDDPERMRFESLDLAGVIRLRTMERGVGCERFAEHIYGLAETFLEGYDPARRVSVLSVTVYEHGGNSAGYSL